MRCQNCKQANGITIRGLCKECAPLLHADHELMLNFVGEADKAFLAATGKTSLEDWNAFEEFLETFIFGKPGVIEAFERHDQESMGQTQTR